MLSGWLTRVSSWVLCLWMSTIYDYIWRCWCRSISDEDAETNSRVLSLRPPPPSPPLSPASCTCCTLWWLWSGFACRLLWRLYLQHVILYLCSRLLLSTNRCLAVHVLRLMLSEVLYFSLPGPGCVIYAVSYVCVCCFIHDAFWSIWCYLFSFIMAYTVHSSCICASSHNSSEHFAFLFAKKCHRSVCVVLYSTVNIVRNCTAWKMNTRLSQTLTKVLQGFGFIILWHITISIIVICEWFA